MSRTITILDGTAVALVLGWIRLGYIRRAINSQLAQ